MLLGFIYVYYQLLFSRVYSILVLSCILSLWWVGGDIFGFDVVEV